MRPWMLIVVLAAGCNSCGGSQTPDEDQPAGEEQPQGPAPVATGTVFGTVRLAGGAEVPAWPPLVTSPTQPDVPEGCPPERPEDTRPVRNGPSGLSNILVAAAEFDGHVPHEPVVHEAFIRDCRIVPLFIAATRGDTLRLKNEVDYPFLPSLGGGGVMQALLHQQTRDIPLDRGSVHQLACGFAAPCGRSDVVVLYHPAHDTTDASGSYRIDNFPAGHEVELHAWHPLFEASSELVNVGQGQERRVDFVLTPAARPPPPPDAGPRPDAGPPENQPGLF